MQRSCGGIRSIASLSENFPEATQVASALSLRLERREPSVSGGFHEQRPRRECHRFRSPFLTNAIARPWKMEEESRTKGNVRTASPVIELLLVPR
jgi:hypothetical protein